VISLTGLLKNAIGRKDVQKKFLLHIFRILAATEEAL